MGVGAVGENNVQMTVHACLLGELIPTWSLDLDAGCKLFLLANDVFVFVNKRKFVN